MRNIKPDSERGVTLFNGLIHDSIRRGNLIETRCGVIAKNLAMSALTFKGVGETNVTCQGCLSALEESKDVTE